MSLPLCDIVVAYSNDHDLGEGWSCLNKNLLQGYCNDDNLSSVSSVVEEKKKDQNTVKPESYIYYRRRLPRDKLVWSPKYLQLGDLLDAKDKQQDWCFATVVDSDSYRGIKVHYTRWTNDFDEWIRRDETNRLAPYGTKSTEDTKITRGRNHNINASLIQAKIDRFISVINEKNYDKIDEYLEAQLSMFVSQMLGYKLNYPNDDEEECVEKIVELLELIVKASVWQLGNQKRPPSTQLLELLKLTLMHDKSNDGVNYFFEENHGHTNHDKNYINAGSNDNDVALLYLGGENSSSSILEHSSHYIHLFNLFHSLGGLKMILSR